MGNYIHKCELCGETFDLYKGEGWGESYIKEGAMLPSTRYVCMKCINKERKQMAGNRAGGIKASLKNKQLHGEDFYQRIGRKGGKNGHTGGFASNPELAKIAGAKGGKKSRRGKSKKTLEKARLQENEEK